MPEESDQLREYARALLKALGEMNTSIQELKRDPLTEIQETNKRLQDLLPKLVEVAGMKPPEAVEPLPPVHGVSVTDAMVTGHGELILGLSDGTTINAGMVRGADADLDEDALVAMVLRKLPPPAPVDEEAIIKKALDRFTPAPTIAEIVRDIGDHRRISFTELRDIPDFIDLIRLHTRHLENQGPMVYAGAAGTGGSTGVALTLTTNGSSGAATYNSTTGVLNIPQYTSGGSGSNYFTNSGIYTYLSTGTNLGVGTATPDSPFAVTNAAGTPAAPQAGTLAHLYTDGTINARITGDVYSSTTAQGFAFQGRRARGSIGTPAAPSLDDTLASFGGIGYGTTLFPAASSGAFVIKSEGSGTDTSQPTYIAGYTAPSGSITSLERFRVTSAGSMGIGTTAPGSRLDVSGSDAGTTTTNASVAMAQVTNTNATDGNFSDFGFALLDSGSTNIVSSKIVGIHSTHTAGSVTGDMAFFTRASGTLSQAARLTSDNRLGVNTTGAPTGRLHAMTSNIPAAGDPLSGLVLENPVAATLGVQTQPPPSIRLLGNGWATTPATSQQVDWEIFASVFAGAAAPTSNLAFFNQIGGVAYGTPKMLLTSAGSLTIPADFTASGFGTFISGLSAGTSTLQAGITTLSGALTGTSANFSGTVALTGSLTITGSARTFTFTRTALGATSTDGVIVLNNTASTVGVPVQISPRITLTGTAWNGSASQGANFAIETLPVAVASGAVTSTLNFSAQINAGGYTKILGLTSGGGTVMKGVSAAIVTKTAAYTVTEADYSLLGDATTAAFTFTLPTAASSPGRIYQFKKIDASANAVTVQGSGAEVIINATAAGANTSVLSATGSSLTIQSNGTSWYVF